MYITAISHCAQFHLHFKPISTCCDPSLSSPTTISFIPGVWNLLHQAWLHVFHFIQFQSSYQALKHSYHKLWELLHYSVKFKEVKVKKHILLAEVKKLSELAYRFRLQRVLGLHLNSAYIYKTRTLIQWQMMMWNIWFRFKPQTMKSNLTTV